jgi:hypothetical protein
MSYQKRISSLMIVLLLLSGCSWLEDWSPRKKNDHVSSSAPLPGKDVEVVSTTGGTWLEAKQNEQKNMKPHVVSEETISNPNLTVEQRIKVLEDRIVKLNDTLDRMLPALTRLASLEKDLSQSLSSITPASGSHASNAVTHSRQAIPSTYKSPSPTKEIKGSIRSVRTGEHGTKTRLVLDATSKLDYSYSIDNQNLSMVIEIPYAAWNAMSHKVLNNSPVIHSYSVSSSSEGGVLLTVKLKAAINVLWASTLEPGSSSNHRIVFDLTRI